MGGRDKVWWGVVRCVIVSVSGCVRGSCRRHGVLRNRIFGGNTVGGTWLEIHFREIWAVKLMWLCDAIRLRHIRAYSFLSL